MESILLPSSTYPKNKKDDDGHRAKSGNKRQGNREKKGTEPHFFKKMRARRIAMEKEYQTEEKGVKKRANCKNKKTKRNK